MGRLQRPFLSHQSITVTAGSSDTQTAVDLIAPYVGAKVHGIAVTQKTAGNGTGTFTLAICEFNQAGTMSSTMLTNTVTIDADGTASYHHGTALGNGSGASSTGVRLGVTTTKTGTVTGSAAMILDILWQM